MTDTAVDPGTLVGRDHVVQSLSHAVTSGEHGLGYAPALIKRVIREDCWRDRYVEATRERATFDSFAAFVTCHPPEGLGTDLALVKRICADDPEALDLIDRATQRPSSVHAVDNIHTIQRPTGTSADRALRKLREDAPTIHARVLAGELSPHAGMLAAGFRRKTATVRVDDPDAAAAFLAKHFNPDEIRSIADLAIHLKEGAS